MHMMFFMQNIDFIKNAHFEKTRKKITFNSLVNVVLIPSFKEMDSSIRNELWWSNSDNETFYLSARKELVDFLQENPSINRIQAMKLLYQPSTIDECSTAINCSAQI